MGELSRAAFLRRAGVGAAGVAFAGVLAGPALADDDLDLANVRLVAATKRLTINWYTTWLGSKPAADPVARPLVLAIRHQEETHSKLLSSILGDTAPVDDDFTFSFPKGALRSSAAALGFAIDLERLVTGIGIGATSTTGNTGLAEALARIAASDSNHFGALSGLGGNPLGLALPAPVGVQSASDQLAPFLS